VFTYTWDCENRLIGVSSNGSEIASYKYDYMGRRYEKAVNGITNNFVYDGWAMIQEESLAGVNSYVYGLDLSGALQGAGTIGGLLVANLDGTNAFFCFDANGNVTDLVGFDGNVVGHYEFDPYGNTTVKAGSLADTNPYRFSTKYMDDETGLVYYGFRFYSPELDRWLSRDPIGEIAGKNLYRFVRNDMINAVDLYGLVEGKFTFDPKDISRPRMVGGFGKAPFRLWSNSCSCSKDKKTCKYNLSCKFTTYAYIMITDAQDPSWTDGASSTPVVAPDVWVKMTYDQKYKAILDHELHHIDDYRSWYNSMRASEEGFESLVYPNAQECNDRARLLEKEVQDGFEKQRAADD
jgi:RHS repeat-associated protein